jgi:hypothetical protein
MKTWVKWLVVLIVLAILIPVSMIAYDAWALRGTTYVRNTPYYSGTVSFALPAHAPTCGANGSGPPGLVPLATVSFHGVQFSFFYTADCPGSLPTLLGVGREATGVTHVHSFVQPKVGQGWFAPDNDFGIRVESAGASVFARYPGFLFFPQFHPTLGAIRGTSMAPMLLARAASSDGARASPLRERAIAADRECR